MNIVLSTQVFWVRSAFSSVLIFIYLSVIFAYISPINSFNFSKKNIVMLITGLLPILYIIQFTDWVVISIDSNLSVTYNIGHKIFLGFIVISFLTILYRYKTILKSLDQTNKMRILYYMVGYLGSSLYVFTTNMLLPLIFNTNVSSLFGPIGYILYSSFHLYAVLRYQLFDIRIVIKKGSFILLQQPFYPYLSSVRPFLVMFKASKNSV